MADEASVSGQGLLDMMRALQEVVGPEVVLRALAALDPSERAAVEKATPLGWVAVKTVQRLNAECARLTSAEVDTFSDQIVRRGVERSFKTVWRVFLTFTSDEALVKRAASMYKKTRNRGEMSARIDVPGRAESTLTAWPDANDRALRTLAVGIETVLRLSGRKDAVTTWERRGDAVVFSSRWSV